MELRDDICSVYLHINSNKRASLSNSLLGQTLKNHATSERAEPLQVTLNIMLTKAIAAIHHLLDTSIIQRDFEDIELTLLEALPVYIAFVMAMHTTTIDTMLARVEGKKKVKGGRKRRKLPASKGSCYDIELLASIMSDEDSGGSDDDFDHDEANEDGGIDGLAQLHDACNLFGAAPVHPDWLDTTCSLREGIDAVVAGQNAAMAIQCLTKLGTVANAQHSKAVKKCMAVLAGKNPGDLVCDAAASLCCLAIDSSNGMLPPDTVFNGENEFQRAVAAVFQIRPVAIQDFYNDSASTGWRAAKEAWIPNCPQQIIGFIQSQSIDGVEASCGEYRAGGDWEMLLSEALTGACTGCGMDDSDNNIWKSFDVTSGESVGQVERVFDAYVLEERWLRIAQGVVSQLMPAAALLRFRQTAANGRNPHPLSNNEGTQVLDPLLLTSNDKEMAEFACPRYTLTEPLRFALLECLSFLARRSARSNGDDLAKRSCFAAASNLLVDAQPCEDIEGIETISMVFDTIEAMQSILVAAQPIDDNYRTSIRHLMSLLIKVLQTRGKSPAMSKIIGRETDVLRIFACISSGTIFVASVLGIARFEKEHLVDDERALRERAIKGLVFVLCADDTFVEDESRAAVAAILGEILELEVAIDSTSNDPLAVRNTLQRILSSLEGCRLQKFVELAYPERKETADCSLHASRTAIGVAKVLALVLCGDTPGSSLKFCHAVFGILQKRLESVATPLASREHSLGVLFLYGCRLGSLDAIGASLIERLSVNILHEPELIQMECLLSFVQGLRAARRDNAKSLALPTTQVKSKASKEGERVERCPVPGGKVTQEEAENLWQEERAKNYLTAKFEKAFSDKAVVKACAGESGRPMDLFVNVALLFHEEALIAIKKVKAAASRDSWVLTIFGLINDQSQGESTTWVLGEGEGASSPTITQESIISVLIGRSGTPLKLDSFDDPKLVPIRAVRAGSFNVKLSLDSTTDRVKRTMLARHGIVRSAVVADSRGRLIIAEPSSLVFCSILPAINTRYVDDPLTTQIGRSQMSVVASHPLSFDIVGMRTCTENERHVVVWGTSEACVVVLARHGIGVERTVHLDLDLEPHECDSDYVLRCDWVPASQALVSVACGTFVKVYSVANAENDEIIIPQLSYNVAYEAVIKDSAWVSLPFRSQSRKGEPKKRKLTLFLLMDTGRLHEIQLQLDNQGNIDGQGSSFLEGSSRCVDIPTVGVRPYEGVTAGKPGSSTRSMGEGCSLCFLPLSNMLLYKCISSCVVALPFDKAGDIAGSFELLPNRLDSEVLGNGPDAYSIVGPYTHWTEIGVLDGGIRLVCVGKSSRTNHPKLLSVVVKEASVKVKEIAWTAGGSVGLGLSLSSSFEGLALFSGPSLSACSKFDERLYFCVVTSNGSILIYGEDSNDSIHAGERPGTPVDSSAEGLEKKGSATPHIALTFYEDLRNVSEADEVKFAGDGIGSGNSDSIKEKLSSKNSVYLMSPSRDGCTVTVTLEGPVEVSKLGDREIADLPMDIPNLDDMGKHTVDLAIVALRFLVGSTNTDCVPSRLFVHGRPFQLTPNVKRWYDVPLTMEEVLMAVRSGSVSVGLGPTFESGNSPMVDAIEVYAVERNRIRHLVPQTLECSRENVYDWSPSKMSTEQSDCASTLVLNTRILSFLYQLVGARVNHDTLEGKSLKHLIRSTALNDDRSVLDSVRELLEQVEANPDLRQKFLDEGTLLGISAALQGVSNNVRQAEVNELEEKHLGKKLKTLLDASVQSAISIALTRPQNYVSATETFSSDGLSPTSIAIDASDILLYAINAGIAYQDVFERIVHLVLAELCIGNSYKESSKSSFATFAIISKMLKLERQDVVERCCNAVRSFVDNYSPSVNRQVADLFKSADPDLSAPIAYQCDSCSKFPITDSRYTLLEDDHDIDLCTKCYQLARTYAEGIDASPNAPVIINGRSIGGSIKLSCGQLKMMESVPIANGTAIVEQVEQALQEAKSAGPRSSDVDNRLRRAIQRSQPAIATSPDKIVINFDTFTDCLFDNIVGLVSYMLDGSNAGIPIGRLNPLLTLVLDSINFGANENAHIARGKRYSREVLTYIRRMLGAVRSGPRSEKTRYVLLINFLRSLGRLTGVNNDDITGTVYEPGETGGQSPDKVKRKTDPRFVCDVHSVPAVRRRCSTGGNKNKRFYVCGMDRKQRCKYFKWADESKTRDRVGQQSRLEKELELFIWQLLSDSSHSQTTSLSDKLCDLMEAEFSRSDCGKGQDISPSEVKSDGDQIPLNNKSRSSSLYDREAAMKDLEDGVFCSKEKKFWVAPLWMCSHDTLALPRELFLPDDESDDQNLADKFIEASLDLVSTVASASSHGDLQMPSNKRWCSLLCEVISANPASRFRPQAKKALKRMCGGNRALYHSVGDHYVFGFQLKEILHHAKATLDGALSVREMARQCGEKWNEEEVSWQRLDAGELLGTIDLIPEDCMTAVNSKRIGAILDELLSVSKSRVDNWRNFCSLLALPVSYHQRPGLSVFGQERLLVERTFSGPPILSLFWLCCTLPGPNQVLVMKLIDLALTSAQDRKSLSTVHSKGSAQSEVFGENIEGVVSDAMEVDTDEVSLPFTSAPQANPEETLLKGTKALSVEDIYAFSIQFVLGGRTADLRRIACQIASKLCRHLEAQSLFQVFRFLIGKPLAEIESMGCSSVQFLQLLQSTMKVGNWKGSHDLAQAARKIAVMFTKQMNLFRWMGGRAQVPLEPGRTILTKRFDLSTCVHCHRLHHPSQKSGNVKAGPQTNEKKSSKDTPRTMSNEKGSTDASQPSEQRWLPDQVRPFVRGRLENSTENTCSSEFAVLVQLKCRLAISEIYATVSEPRGRYAKTIVVSFTPRQVAEVNELKSIDYEHLWQECATLTLTRGATHASCTLPIAVTAANLKFEYRDFYDRVGGSRAADGSFVLFCPRCSRPVNNAHGVCGSCGECLFQCRRCRHIQYDRPDAFLCTECGHCSSGSFSYELNAGIASNAVAIVDDESYARMVKVSRVATKLHCDLQTALVEMVRTGSRKRAPPEVHPLSEYSPAMKRALMGDLPEVDDDIKKGGPSSSERRNNDTSGRMSEGRSSSNAANRARSLLRLARQLRSEGEHSGRSRELLVREAFLGGSEFSLEEVDDDGTDIVGLFGGGDRSDTLTRLIASITGRSNAGRIIERATTNTSTVAAANSNTTALTKKDSSKNSAQECEKLYQLMREAERECHELERRLDAWNRLERDCLKGTILESEVLCSPTKCSRCAGPVTLHLLLLMVRLVRSEKIKHIESVITKDFVRALFVEPPSMVKELFELKRLAITTLCLKSEYAAKLILEELRARLRASSDEVSASILGKLLEHDFSLSAEFLALADETLNSDFMIC
ncbi:zinc ion binding protein [Fragilaria crotonensis]|nr:zinc ion binding protein [Fragilaria crotonensis]